MSAPLAETKKTCTSILIVEDDGDVRRDLINRINPAPTIDVIAAVGTLRDALATLELRPDVALIDLGLPDGDGAEILRKIKADKLKTRTLVFTAFGDERTTLRTMAAGADGYILKTDPAQDILSAIEAVLRGESPMSARTAAHLLRSFRQGRAFEQQQPQPAPHNLSKREFELLELIARGFTYKEAAIRMAISPYTVGEYLKTVYRKMAVRSRNEAVVQAIASGIIMAEDVSS